MSETADLRTDTDPPEPARGTSTSTSAFGAGRRESHDASDFYARFTPPAISGDATVHGPVAALGAGSCFLGDSTRMAQLPDNSVGLVVTSPPYFVGKEYELAVTADTEHPDRRVPETYFDFLQMLREVFAECLRVLEPGGRIAVNVANLGRKPYRSLSADVIGILQDDLGMLLRGEVIWQKGKTSSGSCAWGSFAKAGNPVLRDVTERVVVASKGRFDRALSVAERKARSLPWESTIPNDEFVDVTRDVWEIDAESATRVGHPAPFPVELPRRLIDLYTYIGDIVLDPFAGSGSTLVAAARSGRIGVGFDLDPDYVELANARVATERDRRDRVAAAAMAASTDAPSDGPPAADGDGGDPSPLGALSHDERLDLFQTLAVRDAKKVSDVARMVLEGSGMEVADKAQVRAAGLQFPFVARAAAGGQWFVEVPGAFTTARPGLTRTDLLWKMLGRLHVLAAVEPQTRVLVLTPTAPRRGSEGDKALRAVGPQRVFDVVELHDPAGRNRLAAYAQGVDRPLPGFWDDADLAAWPTARD